MNLFDYAKEAKKRDAALDTLQQTRAHLIKLAKTIAVNIESNYGKVTSPEVVRKLESLFPELMDSVDHRFMGAVFRKDWKRIGFVSEGSHCQPISVWKRK